MRATSQTSVAAASERWEPVLRASGERARQFGEQLFAVADTLGESASLRRALGDPARDGEDKSRLVASLFGARVEPEVVDLLGGLVRSRWSSDEDLTEALEELGASSVLAAAQSRGELVQVEEEIFLVDRLLARERDLRLALSDMEVAPQRRLALAGTVLGARVLPETRLLVERIVLVRRESSLTSALRRVGQLAAARRSRLVATVTAAAPLSHAQEERLAEILRRAYGQAVQVNVGIDPAVMGGIRVEIGADVIDGTVLARLQDAQRRFAG
ncbi:F0F1 ATP synthase subunit delta [Georgenia faecalis]|uniref:ATP synthase subunit delta n=1 Tax=Georgenia faecalis TaxID=2483799 RepID=A0ABV9DCJ9_9MICO|nr:F0F1 ATP synthase subunit delta [Georgenia faecalis]